MKKKWMIGFLVLGYFLILVGLITIQIQSTLGNMEKIFATAAAILLVIPTFILLMLYMNLRTNTEENLKQERIHKSLEDEKGSKDDLPYINDMPPISFTQFKVYCDRHMLSRREEEVGWLIYKGYSNLQIADELYISVTTVKKHVTHIFEKFEVSGRKEFKTAFLQEKI